MALPGVGEQVGGGARGSGVLLEATAVLLGEVGMGERVAEDR
jgi:hypothetical protein